MSNSVQTYMKSTLPPFHQKSYDIRVQSNFVSAQTAQWELYFQCSFCDKLKFKESIEHLVNNSLCIKKIYTYLIFAKQVFFQKPRVINLNIFCWVVFLTNLLKCIKNRKVYLHRHCFMTFTQHNKTIFLLRSDYGSIWNLIISDWLKCSRCREV